MAVRGGGEGVMSADMVSFGVVRDEGGGEEEEEARVLDSGLRRRG